MDSEKGVSRRRKRTDVVFLLEESIQTLPHYEFLTNTLTANNISYELHYLPVRHSVVFAQRSVLDNRDESVPIFLPPALSRESGTFNVVFQPPTIELEPFLVVFANAEHIVTNRFIFTDKQHPFGLNQWISILVSFASSLRSAQPDAPPEATPRDSSSTPLLRSQIPINIFCENLHNCHRRLVLHERQKTMVHVTVDPSFTPSSRKTTVPYSLIEQYNPLTSLTALELCGCTVTQYSTLEQLGLYMISTGQSLLTRLKHNADNDIFVVKKKRDATTDSMWIAMLTDVEGVSTVTATAIAEVYPSFTALMEAIDQADDINTLIEEIASIPLAKKKVGAAIARRIIHIFTTDDPTSVIP